MEKSRGFRLGRKLARVWRLLRRRRPKHRAYLRLSPTTAPSGPSPSQSPHGYHHKPMATMTSKIADWGRCLTRRLCPSSRVCFGRGCRGGETGGMEHYRHRRRLLDGGEDTPRDRLLPSSSSEKDKEENHHRQQQGEAWWKPPPRGHLAVYVGSKDVGPPHRVLVPVMYFNHPLFGELLREAEEEFGYHHTGGITIPCPISDFESVRTRVAAAGISSRHSRRPLGRAGGS